MSKNKKLQIRNSTVEFLVFTAQSGEQSIEARYEDETVWLTQRLMAELFEVTVPTINEHLKNLFDSNELTPDSVIRNFRITAPDGKQYATNHCLELSERELLDHPGKVSQEVAKAFAESEFEKYRIVQDRLFESDFDRHIKKTLEGGKEQP
jgi:hypothetical protein